MIDKIKAIADKGHIYLQRYKVIAIFIILFAAYQCHQITAWWMINYENLLDWQNATPLGIITGYVALLKFALEHILAPHND